MLRVKMALAIALEAALVMPLSANPFEEYGEYMLSAISSGDTFQVAALLRSDFVNPNGFRSGSDEYYFLEEVLRPDILSERFSMLKMLLDAGANSAGVMCGKTPMSALNMPLTDNGGMHNSDNRSTLLQAFHRFRDNGILGFSKGDLTSECQSELRYYLQRLRHISFDGLSRIYRPALHELISAGYDINWNSIFPANQTFAHYVLLNFRENSEIRTLDVDLLIDFGADLSAKDDFGRIPIDYVFMRQDGVDQAGNPHCLPLSAANSNEIESLLLAAGSPPRQFPECVQGTLNLACYRC